MADTVHYWFLEIMRHVPIVTSVGMTLAAVFGLAFLTKKWRDGALLGAVCAAYALTPYMHSWL